MAENLGYIGFQTRDEVLAIYQEIERQLTGGAGRQKNQPLLQTIKEKEIERLQDLYKIALKKEQDFYSLYGLQGDFAKLYAKTKKWSEMTGGALNFQQDSKLIASLYRLAQQIKPDDFYNIVESASGKITSQEWLSLVKDTTKEEIDVQEIVESMLPTVSRTTGHSGSSGITKVNLGKVGGDLAKKYINLNGITIHYTKDGDVEIRFTKSIPSDIKDALTTKLLKLLKEKKQALVNTNKDDTVNKMIQIFRNKLPLMTQQGENIIRLTIYKYWKTNGDIAFGANSSLIRGFLGEVYWTAFFCYAGFRGVPAGVNLKVLSLKNKPVESPTDILVEGVGFQVKNYTEVDGVVTFNQHLDRHFTDKDSGEKKPVDRMIPNQIPLYNFLVGQTHLGKSDADAQTFGKFFFSYYYNKQNKEKDTNNKFASVESYAQSLNKNIHQYIEANAIKLLNIDGNMTLANSNAMQLFSLPPSFNAGKPTFFLINGTPLPVSEIILDVIEGLREEAEQSSYIQVNNVSLDTRAFDIGKTWYEGSGDPGVENLLKSDKGSSGRAYVEYTINMNIQKIAEKALARANQKV